MYKNVCHHFVNEMGVVLIKSGCGQQKFFSALTRALEKNPPFRIPGSAPGFYLTIQSGECDLIDHLYRYTQHSTEHCEYFRYLIWFLDY